MTLVRWNPARELATMEIDRLNRMFGDFFNLPVTRSWVPAVDIYETEAHEYVIKAELPELKRENINVTFENSVLTVKGVRKAEQHAGGSAQRLERQYGSFERTFSLPSTVDVEHIDARYDNGVLTVDLPKAERAKPKQIEIKAQA